MRLSAGDTDDKNVSKCLLIPGRSSGAGLGWGKEAGRSGRTGGQFRGFYVTVKRSRGRANKVFVYFTRIFLMMLPCAIGGCVADFKSKGAKRYNKKRRFLK
jgi:hypothetical protein